MTLDASAVAPAEPLQRPSGLRFAWYVLGGSLPKQHWSWVLHDTTCRTWWLRHLGRILLIIAPLLGAYLVLMPTSFGIRLLTGLTFSGAGFLFGLVNILVETDRRAVRAGYKSGLAEHIRNTQSVERQRLANHQRRERIAQRRARR